MHRNEKKAGHAIISRCYEYARKKLGNISCNIYSIYRGEFLLSSKKINNYLSLVDVEDEFSISEDDYIDINLIEVENGIRYIFFVLYTDLYLNDMYGNFHKVDSIPDFALFKELIDEVYKNL